MKKLAVYFLCGFAGLYIFIVAAWAFSPEPRWEAVGPVQVLTNGKETWIFFQFDQWKRIPGFLVSAPNRTTGQLRQGVVEIGESGVREYRLKETDGPSFGPNSSSIFHHEGDFFLYASPSRNRGDELHRWNGGDNPRFVRMDEPATRAIAHELGLRTSELSSLDRLRPRHDGWSCVDSSYCRPFSPPLKFDEGTLSFNSSFFTLTLSRAPFELVLR